MSCCCKGKGLCLSHITTPEAQATLRIIRSFTFKKQSHGTGGYEIGQMGRISALYGKRIAVFAVGASPYDAKNILKVRDHSLGKDLQSIPFFYMRGVWDEANMTWPDRKLCGMLRKEVAKKPKDQLVSWKTALLEAYEHGDEKANWMNKDQLQPLADWAHSRDS